MFRVCNIYCVSILIDSVCHEGFAPDKVKKLLGDSDVVVARAKLEVLTPFGVKDMEIEINITWVGGRELFDGDNDVIVNLVERYLYGDVLNELVLDLAEELNLTDDGIDAVGVEAARLYVGRDEEGVADELYAVHQWRHTGYIPV